MPRQTDLSLQQLISMLPAAKRCGESEGALSDGCIVNEIGEIFWSGGPESVAAETQLVELTEGGSDDIRWVAYKYLSDQRGPQRSAAALKAVQEYEERENA